MIRGHHTFSSDADLVNLINVLNIRNYMFMNISNLSREQANTYASHKITY